jgi:CRISPR-associated endonuclease/helicase Cas3
MFFAHSTENTSGADWQSLHEHLVSVAAMAATRGAKFGAGKPAALAGLMHDLGKYAAAFQRRLAGAAEKVDHSTAGAQEVRRLAVGGGDRGVAELIAYAIAGHHAGLPDGIGGESSLSDRLKRIVKPLDPVWRQEISPDAIGLLPGFRWERDPSRLAFQLGLFGRMIFSCLVDADFRDTEAFYGRAEGKAIDRDWPMLPAIVDRLIAAFDEYMAEKRSAAADTGVNHLRAEILAHVRAGAGKPTGLFTLTVPTGGGKTLASLAFALDHAKRHALDRIIYAIPFTSIIDQTAAVFRDVLGGNVVLEHHSAIEQDSARREADFDEGVSDAKLRLAMEDWAAPIVVTTNVQLFESLFSNRTSRCRKLHNLARSVIVLDEAQTIPLPVLRPCVAALDELARNYGASIVLCTATQPALKVDDGFVGGLAIPPERELAPDPAGLARALKRVEVRRVGETVDEDLVGALSAAPQCLVIVNSRAHALSLYRHATKNGLDGAVHLTTRQYATHRREILNEVRARLANGLPCRLIATSLVEAGVDLDFPAVWRAEAGLDQIAQAAGRCNREGKRPVEASIVTIFKPVEFKPPREIAQLAGDFERMADKHIDILSPAAIREYFGEVYWRKGPALDVIHVRDLDGAARKRSVLDAFKVDRTSGADFAYRTVGENFRLIESGMVPVIVARSGASREKPALDALAELAGPESHAGRVARILQPFIVQVPPKARALLLANGHVRFVEDKRFGDQFCALVTGSLYREDTGLSWEDADYLQLENTII